MRRNVSLLFKTERKPKQAAGFDHLKEDLNLDKILDCVFPDAGGKEKAALLRVLLDLETNVDNINYRLAITEELLEKPYLPHKILEVTAQARSFTANRKQTVLYRRTNSVRQLHSNLELLLNYLRLFDTLAAVLQERYPYKSEGLRNLTEYVCGCAASSEYRELINVLRQLRDTVRGPFRLNLTIGRDLSHRLRLAEITGLDKEDSSSPTRKRKGSFLDHVFGGDDDKPDPLLVTDIMFLEKRCVAELFEKTMLHLEGIVSSVTSALMRFFRNLEEEVLYYKAVVELLQVVRGHGLPVCRPQFIPREHKKFIASGIYDLRLALHLASKQEFSLDAIVKNDVFMDSERGLIFIVTGPNQGGKTTYLRAVGLVQLLAQAGILVPAESAVISPVDRIFTHFASAEQTDDDRGRLEEEMVRLRQIMQEISGDSLLLMKEWFSSTNAHEGAVIAEEILRALSIIGARVVFVTHLYELAARVGQINTSARGVTKLANLVAGIERIDRHEGGMARMVKRTYKIEPGEPMPHGFVSDIAYQFGISYEELVKHGSGGDLSDGSRS